MQRKNPWMDGSSDKLIEWLKVTGVPDQKTGNRKLRSILYFAIMISLDLMIAIAFWPD